MAANGVRFPGASDDHSLNFTYNKLPEDVRGVARWLDKAYARIGWWIYVRPIIDHPDIPGRSTWAPIPDASASSGEYGVIAERQVVEYYFPKDCVIDVEQKRLLRVENGRLVPVGDISMELFVS